ncbi:ribonuclease T [Sphingomonas sp. S1-29]|uniref:ribonuclease T2 family protein n=1 Tax=Sphingomonas sp. S1-29 TaxID=2991074 RepID=UPI0022401479|nr:ribonuclease T [Sphingomonas sp. S1-29]UZK70368.1 ribonuclease T [Sphingomonas sp. S1-29]
MSRLAALGIAAAALLAPLPAIAQAYRCSMPIGDIARPRPDGPTAREPRRVVPTGSYTLALTWSPQYCRENGKQASARLQCGGGNRFGFTLHGLWPDGKGTQWPQYCRPAALLDTRVIQSNLCATPSPQLLQHEYAKHGTCMNLAPAAYFDRATGLYARIRYPDMNALSRRRRLTTGQFAQAFARANRGMTAAMVKVTADRQGWLDEAWVCLDTQFRYRACPRAGRAANLPLKIWRGGAA